jgi:polyisoprenoid-binding protein YceI
MHELGPDNGSITIRTGRTGLAARAGHDLVIDVERWRATLLLSPSDPEGSRLEATVDATSLRVREGHGGVKPLTDSDREEIQRTIVRKVLRADRNPEIRFESTAIQGTDQRQWRVEGRLTIAGATMPIVIPIEAAPGEHGTVLTASVAIVQSDFGIKPYTGMMGALKVADTVDVRVEARIMLEGVD